MRRAIALALTLGCLAAAPVLAQGSRAAPAAVQSRAEQAGPRLTPQLESYRPMLAGEKATTAAAAADRVTITITTLGLILLIVLLIVLIA